MSSFVGQEARPVRPLPAAILIACVGFISLLTEILPAGLLPQIARDLGVSVSVAGQGIVAFAIGCIVAAIPLTRAAAGWNRRSLLIAVVVVSAVANLGTAVAPEIVSHLASRFVAGLAAGVVWAMIPGYVRGFTAPGRLGATLGVAFLGGTLSLALGVPLGTVLGESLGWRAVFAIIVGVTVLVGVIVAIWAPRVPGITRGADAKIPAEASLRAALGTPAVLLVLATVTLSIVAQNLGYTYLTPILTFGAGEPVLAPSLVFALFGIASIVGTFGCGRLSDRYLAVSLVSAMAAGVLGLAGIGLAVWPGVLPAAVAAPVTFVSALLWGYAFGGYSVLFQVLIARAGGAAADAAQSVMVTVWNISIALGGLLGGLILAGIGTLALLPIGAVLMVFALFPVLRVLAGVRAEDARAAVEPAVVAAI
ncbi:MFS transporter [Mycetocola tolaasinivorans]|uniref:MFS transporter n=1 Tax=Mycetocola tolaasinivorans TaxID=76635 RepID=A0A3L7A3J2_9MICO|nr:MFS transporter [Mycetocola tolaasinivorans]RLP74500.1 MFS transporter [Mycetocola tolaasinivorans]